MFSWGKLGIFLGGVLFGTAGISILSTKEAKKVYTHATAAALRGKDAVMKRGTIIKENIDDIVADAEDINAVKAIDNEDKALEEAEALVAELKAKKVKKAPVKVTAKKTSKK